MEKLSKQKLSANKVSWLVKKNANHANVICEQPLTKMFKNVVSLVMQKMFGKNTKNVQ